MFERKNENKVKKQFENVGDLIIIMRWLLLIGGGLTDRFFI